MRVKLIASLGPSSSSSEVVESLLREGVSGFRINLAHGGLSEWRALIGRVRNAESSVGRLAAVIVDIRGPSLRLGDFPDILQVEAGSLVKFCKSGYSKSELRVPFPHEEVIKGLAAGDLLVMDDGRARFRVMGVHEECFTAQALTACELKSRKNVAFPERRFELPYLTGEDVGDVKELCRDGIDYVGASHVRSAEDVETLRNFLRSVGCDASVIAKVESRDAVMNLSELAEASDALLVARGDLGMNFGLEEVPVLQEAIIDASLKAGKPVIVATQLLESMMINPVPTRAEVSDVSTAVMEGVDALMLTGETAVGKHPIEAVRWLRKIAGRVESIRRPATHREGPYVIKSLKKRYAKGVVELAEDVGGVLAIYSMKGTTAFSVASLRPETRFYVAVPNESVARKLSIVWGAQVMVIKASDYMEGLERLYSELLRRGELREDEIAVLTYGLVDREQVIKVRSVSAARQQT